MAKKNNGVENKNKNNDGGEKKKEDGPIASKTVKWVKSFQGAGSVKSEGQANKLTVVGNVDPTKLRDELATKTKNKVDLVSPQPKNDSKVNKDDANDTKKKQPEKTDNDEKPKEALLTTAVFKLDFHYDKYRTKAPKVEACTTGEVINSTNRYVKVKLIGCFFLVFLSCVTRIGCRPVIRDLLPVTGSMDVHELVLRLREKLKRHVEIVPPNKKNGGNGGNDDCGSGAGGGDEKKKEEHEGNGGGKMKYPGGQSGFGQFSYGKVYRHGYGYQNGALKRREKMLLLCCEVFGLLVMYNHLAKDIYTDVTLHTHHLLHI